jgi:calcium-dependent protein kinase
MAVSYLHSKNIVHRDLKPENIVLDSSKPRQNIKIIDFGTSRELDAQTKLNTKVGTAYYIAPEVLDMDYDSKCDIWSCGVILYVLLCGYPPFNGSNEEKIIEKIKTGKFGFPADEWDHISPNAKEIVKSMLTLDPKKRPSADQILQEPWFDELQQSTIDISVKSNVIANLKSFKTKIRLQKAVFLYFVNFFDLKKQRQQLLTVFKSMDKDFDGRLSYEEILNAYSQIYDEATAKSYVDHIFEVLDFNKSAELEFSEFMVANVDYAKSLNNKKLKQIFDIIDDDGSGSISPEELKKFLNLNDESQDSLVMEMISEVDKNNDGVVSYDEFLAMMDGYYQMI